MKNRLSQILLAGALVLVCSLIVRSQFAPAEANAYDPDTGVTNLVATAHVAAPIVYDLYDASAGTGYRKRTFAVTLSSGTNTVNYGAGIEPVGCVGYYNQSTVRSFAINFGHVAAQRTMTIKLGGGGTTGDAIAGQCITKETR